MASEVIQEWKPFQPITGFVPPSSDTAAATLSYDVTAWRVSVCSVYGNVIATRSTGSWQRYTLKIRALFDEPSVMMQERWLLRYTDCMMVSRHVKQRIGYHIRVWQGSPWRLPGSPKWVLRMYWRMHPHSLHIMCYYRYVDTCSIYYLCLLNDDSFIHPFSGDVPCPHLSSECIHTAVRVQGADRGCQCEVKTTWQQRQSVQPHLMLTLQDDRLWCVLVLSPAGSHYCTPR